MLLGENTIGNPEELILLSAAEGDLSIIIIAKWKKKKKKKKEEKKLSPRDYWHSLWKDYSYRARFPSSSNLHDTSQRQSDNMEHVACRKKIHSGLH